MFVKLESHTPNFVPFAFGVSFGGNISISKPKNISSIDFQRKNSPGFHLGFLASFRQRSYYFETGLEYLSEGYMYKLYNKDITKPTINYYQNENKFYALTVPIKLSLPFPDRYVIHTISFGIYSKFLIKQSAYKEINYNNGTVEKDIINQKKQYSGFYPTFNLSYGIDIPIDYNEQTIRIEPYTQFSFISSRDSNLSNTLTAFGLRATFFWLN
jgi:hypothetical protein